MGIIDSIVRWFTTTTVIGDDTPEHSRMSIPLSNIRLIVEDNHYAWEMITAHHGVPMSTRVIAEVCDDTLIFHVYESVSNLTYLLDRGIRYRVELEDDIIRTREIEERVKRDVAGRIAGKLMNDDQLF